MLVRIITAVVSLGILVPILIFGGVWGACAVIAVAAAVSVYEMLDCCGLKKELYISIPFIAFSVLYPISTGLLAHSINNYISYDYSLAAICSIINAAALLLPVIWVIFAAVIRHSKLDAEKLFMFLGLYFYISQGFRALAELRFNPNKPDSFGLFMLAYVLIIAWGTDTFAYFTGMAFGKRKLCPNISPKKTVAGAIGGTLLGSAVGIAFLLLAAGIEPLTVVLACCAPLFSIVSQFGDLAASVIKRKFGVKDYGKIFPGHGGVLDRFDSVLAVAIAVYLVMGVATAIIAVC